MRFRFVAALLCFVLPCVASARENKPLALAVKDILSIPIHDRQFMRYVWIEDESKELLQATSLTMNYLSRSSLIARPVPVDASLARVDLRQYVARDAELGDLRRAWSELRFDPSFSLLLTKDTLAFSKAIIPVVKVKEQVLVDCPPYKEGDQTFTQKWVWQDKEVNEIKEGVLQVVSPHLNQKAFAILAQETGSLAPIVNARYFIVRSLSTIQDKGVYKTIYGGLYYDFIGLKTNNAKGTDEDNLFESLGVGDVKSGITAEKVFERLRSDQRVAMFKSGVTGRPRRADFLRTLAGLDSQSIISVTHDLRHEDVDIGVHPVMNLLKFKDAARETIFEKSNGLHGFALFDGNGKRQDEVPPDIAVDHTVPAPHSTRLQAAIGCIRCHAKEGGWRFCRNDAKSLLGNLLDIFPERNIDDVSRLSGLYAGDVERKLLPRGRDDYASAILRATGPWKAARADQTDTVQVSGQYLSSVFQQYWYDEIDASRALIALGHQPDGANSAKKLRALLPPVNLIVNGRVPEDPRIAALLVGITVMRPDFDLTYSFMATRISQRGGK